MELFPVMWDVLKDFEVFYNSFLKEWRLLFRNVRLLKDIFREVEAFFINILINKYVAF
jgi:hypothetical protein